MTGNTVSAETANSSTSGNLMITYRKSVLYLKCMKQEAASSFLFQSTQWNIFDMSYNADI